MRSCSIFLCVCFISLSRMSSRFTQGDVSQMAISPFKRWIILDHVFMSQRHKTYLPFFPPSLLSFSFFPSFLTFLSFPLPSFLLFGSTRDWTQGLMLARQALCHLSHAPVLLVCTSPCSVKFIFLIKNCRDCPSKYEYLATNMLVSWVPENVFQKRQGWEGDQEPV
jgi:hypothetical protein